LIITQNFCPSWQKKEASDWAEILPITVMKTVKSRNNFFIIKMFVYG